MILFVMAVIAVFWFTEKLSGKFEDASFLDEDSIWYDEYEEERKKLYEQAKENNTTVTVREMIMLGEKYDKMNKVYERILLISFISLLVFTVLWIMFGSYQKNETIKYSLIPIQDQSILDGQSEEKTYYIAEIVNKDNSYLFFYGNEKTPERMEIVAYNIIKYEDIDCEPCVVKEMKINVLKCAWLQAILFFRFDNNNVLEENYKFYVPKENYIKTFSY